MLINPSYEQIRSKFTVVVDNKHMEYDHPMIYETFKWLTLVLLQYKNQISL